MNILEQIGVTKEEIIDRIVSRALGIAADFKQTGKETWENIPLSSVIDKKIDDAIGNLVKAAQEKINKRINEIMDEKINHVFNEPFYVMDKWGSKTNKLTTIRDLIADNAQNYWTAKVDAYGNPDESYSNKFMRADWYAKKVMHETFDKEINNNVEKFAEELRKLIPKTIATEIQSVVMKHIKY